MKLKGLLRILLPIFVFGNFTGAWSADQTKLIVTGSSTVAPLALELGKKFESIKPGSRIDVQTGGSSRGVADQRQGLNDIGMVSRDLKPEERDLTSYTIARDGICIILNKANAIAELTSDQIVKIYTGKIKNWRVVGGANAPITVVSKGEGRSTLELFLEFFKIKSSDVEADVIVGDNEQDIKTVSGNPNAIGYVSIGAATFNVTQGVKIKSLPLNGVAPTAANVLSGKFPLSRPLNLVMKNKPSGITKEFIEFAQSRAAIPFVQDQFFIPIVSK